MREILFRGKRLGGSEWVQGWLVAFSDGVFAIGSTDADENGKADMYTVDPATVGQYTGLTDKNGKRIFEGDIVKVKHGYCGNPNYPTKDVAEVVEYNQKSCCYEFYRWSGDIYDLEIIGNIHDNPELLEG